MMFNSFAFRLFFISCIVSTFSVSAQTDQQPLAVNISTESISQPAERKAAPGTYQFIVLPDGLDEAFPSDILVIAELLRQENEATYHRLSPNVTLKIISRKEVAERKYVDEFLILKNEK